MPIDRSILVFALNIADAAPLLAALESHNEKCFVRSIVILLSSAPTTHGASLADLILSDHESHCLFCLHCRGYREQDGVVGAIACEKCT